MNFQKQIPVHSIHFWSNYLIHMRPYLFFVSGAAGLAGMAYHASFNMMSLPTILSFVAVFFSYGFGQALTDCYQVDTDSISAPYRPLSRGILSIKMVKVVSLIGLVSVTSVLIILNPGNVLLCVLGVLGLLAYSFVKRRFWYAGPPLNAFIVGLLVLMGYLAISGESFIAMVNPTMMAIAGLAFFTYINFVLIGYLKDITADRETGYNTFPVLFGWNRAVWIGDLNVVICAVIYWTIGIHNPTAIVIGVIALSVAISGQLYAHFVKEKKEENAAYPVISTVRSMILWLMGIVVNFNPGMLIFSIVFYLFFEITIYYRPMHSQI